MKLLFGVYSGKILILLLGIGAILFKPFVKHIKIMILNKLFGSLPNVNSIVKKDKIVYIHKNYHNSKVQLIYRHGHIKKILEDLETDRLFEEQYSLEWNEEYIVVLRKYDICTHKMVLEKYIMLPKK